MGILGELWVKLGLRNEGLNKGLDDSKKKVSGFANYMSKLGGTMAAAFSVKEIVAFTRRTAELANKAKGVRDAFNKLGDPTLLNSLRKATAGTVDDLQLMQTAIQANNFKIPLDQLATYLKFATMEAQRTGKAADYLVESIILGLGRQSVQILDNLGFSAAEIREQMKGGASMAEAVGKIIKERMPEAASEIDNAAVATERLASAWTNLQLAVGNKTSGVWNFLKGEFAGMLSLWARVMNAEGFTTSEKIGMVFGGWNSRENWNKLIDQERAQQQRQEQAKALAEERVGKIKNLNEALKEQEKIEREIAWHEKHHGKDNVYIDANKIALQLVKNYIEQEKVRLAEEAKAQQQKRALIPQLEAEIKKKEKLRNLSANEDEIRQLNDEIAAMKERLRILQMTSEEYKKYQESLDKSLKKVDGIFDVPKIQANTNAGLEILNQGVQAWQESNAKAVEQQAVALEAIEMLNQSITAGITGSLGELANAITGVNGANIGTVVKTLLSPLADAAISAGLLVMGVGKAIVAFNTSLKTLQGPIAIASGAALVAVGLAAKAGLAAIGNNPTQAGGYNAGNSTSYSGGYGINAASYSPAESNYTLTTQLKGQDIWLAVQRTQANNRR